MSDTTPSSRGFTLVEVLAATVLAALLMLAVMHVIGSIGHSQATLETAARQGAVASPQILALVRFDLENARTLLRQGTRVTLAGYGALDPVSRWPMHQPAVVTYAIKTSDQESWLVREQTTTAATGDPQVITDLVCPGVSAVDLVSPGGTPALERGAPTGRVVGVPGAMILLLTFQGHPPSSCASLLVVR